MGPHTESLLRQNEKLLFHTKVPSFYTSSCVHVCETTCVHACEARLSHQSLVIGALVIYEQSLTSELCHLRAYNDYLRTSLGPELLLDLGISQSLQSRTVFSKPELGSIVLSLCSWERRTLVGYLYVDPEDGLTDQFLRSALNVVP